MARHRLGINVLLCLFFSNTLTDVHFSLPISSSAGHAIVGQQQQQRRRGPFPGPVVAAGFDTSAEGLETQAEAQAQAEEAEAQAGDKAEAEAELEAEVEAEEAEAETEADASHSDAAAARVRLCPDVDDHHGRWSGSRQVGGTYTLTCAPGFEVIGTRGNGSRGSRSAHTTCPPTLEWPAELWCEDIDDCAALRHGCGALGVCIDLVSGYDCNCEQGYPRRHSQDGEIVCGDREIDEEICAGHSCGAYGLCIDLRGNLSQFEADAEEGAGAGENSSRPRPLSAHEIGGKAGHTYRCECTDGFYDDGSTCVPRDCGELADQLGVWVGSTHAGGEYTLKCLPGAYVWGGALREITITCGNRGRWLSRPICVDPALQLQRKELKEFKSVLFIGMVLLCVSSAALAAGLTLGMVSLDPFGLKVILNTDPRDCPSTEERKKLKGDQWNAKRMLPVIHDHHMLLVTLLLFNTIANEALPIFLDELVPSWAAVLISVSVVLVCGEILPSAVFTGTHQFKIAATFVPFVGTLQLLLWPITKPIARLLDYLIPEEPEDEMKYSRAELRALVKLHGRHAGHPEATDFSRRGSADHSEGPPSPGGGPPGHGHGHGLGGCLEPHGGSEDGGRSEGHGGGGHGGGRGRGRGGGRARPDGQGTQMLPLDEQMEEGDAELTETTEDDEEHSEGQPVLSGAELKMINSALSLGGVALRAVPYAHEEECLVVSMHDPAADVLARGEVCHRHRAVLVVDVPSAGPIYADSLLGCLRTSDLLQGGRQSLRELQQPWVRVLSTMTALKALQTLTAAGASLAAVVGGADAETGRVLGVLSSTDVLSVIMGAQQLVDDPQSEESDAEPTLRPINRRRLRVGSKIALSRSASVSAVTDPAALSTQHPHLVPRSRSTSRLLVTGQRSDGNSSDTWGDDVRGQMSLKERARSEHRYSRANTMP